MQKFFRNFIPIFYCAVAITIVLVGYFLFEYKAEMACGLGAPIGVSACFLCFTIVELICINKDHSVIAILFSFGKFCLFSVGLFFVFKHSLSGMAVALIFCLIPILLPIAIAILYYRFLAVIAFMLAHLGLIAECVIFAVCYKNKKWKKLEEEKQENENLLLPS